MGHTDIGLATRRSKIVRNSAASLLLLRSHAIYRLHDPMDLHPPLIYPRSMIQSHGSTCTVRCQHVNDFFVIQGADRLVS